MVTAYQLACGHVERTIVGSIIVELFRVPNSRTYNVTVWHAGRSEYLGAYTGLNLHRDVYRWYRVAVEQVRQGKWY